MYRFNDMVIEHTKYGLSVYSIQLRLPVEYMECMHELCPKTHTSAVYMGWGQDVPT